MFLSITLLHLLDLHLLHLLDLHLLDLPLLHLDLDLLKHTDKIKLISCQVLQDATQYYRLHLNE